eukprot:PhM_4_TR4241/c0_g1_i1/m.15111
MSNNGDDIPENNNTNGGDDDHGQPQYDDLPQDGGAYDNDDVLSDVSDLDPESDILAPVQRRIEAHLQKHLEDLTLRMHEANNDAGRLKQRREDVGVELYSVQQHLAKLQETLESGHDNLVALQRLRDEKEKERDKLLVQYDDSKKRIDELRKKYYRHQTELDKLSETLLRVEQFNAQIQSEIQIERRATYKAEDDVAKMERVKQKQDFLIDALNERIKMLGEQLALYTHQLTAQREETKLAQDTLAEAQSEMEAIQYEKKQLLQQWKTSLIGMQRRDEALRSTETELRKQNEDLMALDNEIVGYRQEIKKCRNKSTNLSNALMKVETEVAQLDRKITSLAENKEQENETYIKYKNNLERTESENKQLESAVKSLQMEVATTTKRTQKVAQEVLEMENRILESLSNQTTIKKGSQSTLQDIEKLRNTIRDKEMHVTSIENELARIRVDTLQTKSHNEVLQATLSELEKDLHAKDTLIEKMQVDIRRKHDEIERKQKSLDALNRQYDSIMASHGVQDGEGVGPLEATINNLSKAISQKSQENDVLQRDWIRSQTELVNTTNKADKLHDEVADLKSRATILTQKRNRIVDQAEKERRELRELERQIQNMHLESRKLNTLISDNSQKQDGAANDNFNLENDLVRRLQEKKREAVQLETLVEQTRNAKQELLASILEAERTVMFWEKKIQIAKETELALDPTVGKEEVNRMKREIYIMEQRLHNLKREQKRKVEEMQKQIDHRDVLRTKGEAIQAATKGGQKGTTKATVVKENQRLNSELQSTKEEAVRKERQIKECLANTEKTALEVERVQGEIGSLQEQCEALKAGMDLLMQERQIAEDTKQRKLRALHRFQDAERGHYQLVTQPDAVEQHEQHLSSQKRALKNVVQELLSVYPNLSRRLGDVLEVL